jgi:hypothetical protein
MIRSSFATSARGGSSDCARPGTAERVRRLFALGLEPEWTAAYHDVRVVVLADLGKHACAGASIKAERQCGPPAPSRTNFSDA